MLSPVAMQSDGPNHQSRPVVRLDYQHMFYSHILRNTSSEGPGLVGTAPWVESSDVSALFRILWLYCGALVIMVCAETAWSSRVGWLVAMKILHP